MPGTPAGSRKAVETIYKRHGKDFFAKAGAVGGKKSRGGGFGEGEAGRARAIVAGKKGGLVSRRGPNKQPKQRWMNRIMDGIRG